MYAHERTMLAKLGFADPDRREPLHQLACQYLATPEAIDRLIPHFGLEHGPVPQEYQCSDSESFSELCRTVASCKASLEHEIAKGCDQYRTTIGFADLVLILSVEDKSFNIRRRSRTKWGGRDGWLWTDWHIGNDHIRSSVERCGIEVKITPTATGDVIRQVKLYRSYSRINDWTVVTAYDLSASDIASLQNENIRHLRLGKRFDEYVALRQNDEVAVSLEI